MLSPKRIKFRKRQRGTRDGVAHRGNYLAFGEFGLMALEPKWITNRQIEAARIAMTRHIKRGGSEPSGGIPCAPRLCRGGTGSRGQHLRGSAGLRGDVAEPSAGPARGD